MIADPNCILFEPSNLFELIKITNNLSFNILTSMKLYLLDFTNNDHLLNWNMDGHGPSIALTLLDRTNWPLHINPTIKPHFIRKQLNSLQSIPHIRYVGQCCDALGIYLRPWQCLRPLINFNLRGCTPTWYNALKNIITDNNSGYNLIQDQHIQQPNLLVLTKRPSLVSTKRFKKEWIIFKQGSSTHYGHIIEKSQNFSILTVQHWTANPSVNLANPITLSLCTSC